MKLVSLLISSQTGSKLNCLQVALFGEFFSRDLKAILNRITLHSESSHPMHLREIVFEPFDAHQLRENGNEPVILRAKKELGEPDSGWCGWSILVLTRKLTV
jgi:mediator of RNA polymerase II transcription subunit 18